MSARERRISPRKECIVPLRFRVIASGHTQSVQETSKASSLLGTFDGQLVNLSERGIYFRSREKMSIGQPLEMCLTIPRELTGRMSEQVRCGARVVHVEPRADTQGMLGVGAAVDRFEPIAATRDWDN
jgi:hypothetical protein